MISIYSNIVRISGNVGELCRRYGEPLTPALPDAFTFPSPARLAEVGEAEFRAMGLGFRARFLSSLAGAVPVATGPGEHRPPVRATGVPQKSRCSPLLSVPYGVQYLTTFVVIRCMEGESW